MIFLHIQGKWYAYNQDLRTVGFDLIKAPVSQNISRELLPKLGYNNRDSFIASLHTGMKVDSQSQSCFTRASAITNEVKDGML